MGGALVARVGRVVMEGGGRSDNAGGRGLVRGGGPIPNPRVGPTFITDMFCLRGRGCVGRPLPASVMVGSLEGRAESHSSSLRTLRLRDVIGGSDEEKEAGILANAERFVTVTELVDRRVSRSAFRRRVDHVMLYIKESARARLILSTAYV